MGTIITDYRFDCAIHWEVLVLGNLNHVFILSSSSVQCVVFHSFTFPVRMFLRDGKKITVGWQITLWIASKV